VFLSYASEDTADAERIATALRAAGIEVWFDKSELRGGDAWDHKIRRQIRDCVLFVPIISRNSEARSEGYFRLEWDLADQRSHMIVRDRAFIVPVCLDGTPESDAGVPESFQRVQWTRLPRGETSPEFAERIRRLLSLQTSHAADGPRPAPGFTPAVPAVASRTVGRWRWEAILVAAAAVFALAYFRLDRWVLSGHALPGAGLKSVAVLPLKNESGDPSQQYFSDGISEDLITALAQVPGVKVIGRASSFHFRDSTDDSRTIGEKLGVAHLIEGSVRRAGDTVRVSAELVNTSDGSTQWSERYDRPYKDLFALQDEITHAVAGALRTKLVPGGQAEVQSERPPSGSLEAYNAFLQGQFYYARDTEADYRKAIESYTRATELDPSYALAWSELSRTWTGLANEFLGGAPAQEAYAQGRTAADRALTLSPELAAAHVARGWLLLSADFDWRGAEAEYRHALELAPNDGWAKFHRGNQLAIFGEVEQAIELTRQALATEPLKANWYVWLAKYLSGLNRLDEAEQAIRRAIELQPGASGFYWQLTIIEVQRGNAQAALAAGRQEPHRMEQDTALALARQLGGDQSAADAALRTLIEKYAVIEAYQIAQVYAVRNDAKATFQWLDRAWSNRDPGINTLFFDPFILRYKDDPRFAAFCRRVGLPVPGKAVAHKT
jgi:TolB-like protein/Tfp pilus assembly protein PilF